MLVLVGRELSERSRFNPELLSPALRLRACERVKNHDASGTLEHTPSVAVCLVWSTGVVEACLLDSAVLATHDLCIWSLGTLLEVCSVDIDETDVLLEADETVFFTLLSDPSPWAEQRAVSRVVRSSSLKYPISSLL